MNYTRAIFLISDDVRAVMATYEQGDTAARTMFKTFDPGIKVDDYVVVPTNTRHEMTVCKIVETDVEPDLEASADINWIIGVVNRVDFEQITQQENDAINKIKVAELKRKRRELRSTMMEGFDEEIKALPIYTAENGGAAEETSKKD